MIIPPDPAHGKVSCMGFGGDKICQVACETGYVPERPHAQSYIYSSGKWTVYPAGPGEFPWADCVKSCKYTPVAYRKIPVISPGLIQLRKGFWVGL